MRPVFCAMSVHAEKHQMVKISGALLYGVFRNHIVVLERETPDIMNDAVTVKKKFKTATFRG